MTRRADQLRPWRITRRFTRSAPGSVLVRAGRTMVLCTASVEPAPPAWLDGQNKGWITAQYSMLPGSTSPRRPRERGAPDGRSVEIQRLIGRSLRAVADLEALGPRQIVVDCDVLEADGGTRTAAITGGFVALADAAASIRRESPDPSRPVLRDSVAAVSVGLVGGRPRLDLDYALDAAADVDMNVVATGRGRFVEIQGSGEEATFDDQQLQALLELARRGLRRLRDLQRTALGGRWAWD